MGPRRRQRRAHGAASRWAGPSSGGSSWAGPEAGIGPWAWRASKRCRIDGGIDEHKEALGFGDEGAAEEKGEDEVGGCIGGG